MWRLYDGQKDGSSLSVLSFLVVINVCSPAPPNTRRVAPKHRHIIASGLVTVVVLIARALLQRGQNLNEHFVPEGVESETLANVETDAI
jgi:hypothetical protein